ncbi:helix-turn-helix domain-containing protein [Bacillus idriensis]|uniref:Helix-turn-helix domain-containing protein n=1 Tax=Metabacillus idriensis TaxID=324768 RepID=A0A6I2MAM2_9BACI|nr:helix-turn-helix domain-containing protein [Metabacillus idriensis]MRX52853.1 helix-turn-helix domain-containing protein [Metabacillus idriensis]
MNKSKMNLILHPVRIKIVQSLLNGKEMTVQQLGERTKDVPQATLYRHLNKLLEAKIIQVVKENQIRGTIEKVYALNEPSVQSQEDFLKLTSEEHLELFMNFTTQLMGMYESYLQNDEADLVKDGVSYAVANVHLSDSEFMELVKGIAELLQNAMLNEPSPERKGRNIATIVIPDKKP